MTIKKILATVTLVAVAQFAVAGKIVVFNPESALLATKHAETVIEKLKANPEYAQMTAQIESLQTDLKSLAKESETKGMTWSQEQVAAHRKKMEYVQADLQLAAKKIQAENQAVIGKIAQELQPKMDAALSDIMKAEGIDAVLRPQAVIKVNSSIDITAKVVDAINKAK